jgi:hypothetical protein
MPIKNKRIIALPEFLFLTMLLKKAIIIENSKNVYKFEIINALDFQVSLNSGIILFRNRNSISVINI